MTALAPEALEAERPTRRAAHKGRGLIYRFTRSKTGVIGFFLATFIVGVSLIAPLVIDHSNPSDPTTTWLGPSSEYWLGTDNAGRDIFKQILLGGRTVVIVGFGAAALTTLIAVVLGSLAAYLRGRTDMLFLQLTDIVMTVPLIVLLTVLGAFFRITSPVMLAILIGALLWPILMRSIRAQVLTLKEREFVEASRLLDLGTGRIVFTEIVPNMVGFILINFIIAITNAIYALVGIYVLGLAPLSEGNWGTMIQQAYKYGAIYIPQGTPFIMAPLIAIALLQLGLVMLARSLEEVFNPRLQEG